MIQILLNLKMVDWLRDICLEKFYSRLQKGWRSPIWATLKTKKTKKPYCRVWLFSTLSLPVPSHAL
jgi:hypothetical protein